jgi:hypothetical protein
MDRDLIDSLKAGKVLSAGVAGPTANLAPQVATVTVTSASIDTQGFHSFVGVLQVGAYGTAASGSVYIEGELQVSNDNATWIAAADADILLPPADAVRTAFGTTAASGCFFQSKTTGAADLTGLYMVGYLGLYRYLRINVRLTGTQATGTPVSAVLIASHPDYFPVSGNPS